MTETQHIRALTVLPEADAPRVIQTPDAPGVPRGPSLRTRLVVRDVAALLLATAFVVVAAPEAWTVPLPVRLAILGATAFATWLAIIGQGLYRARNCSIRSVEVLRVGRAAVIGAVAGELVAARIGHPMLEWILVTAGLGFVAVTVQRGAYAARLRRERAEGRHCRAVVVIGGRSESERLVALLGQHPELGLRAVGTMGRRRGEEPGNPIAEVPWIGDLEGAARTLETLGVDSVILAAGDLNTEDLNTLVRELLAAGVHVQLSSGLWGVTHSRLRAVPLAHEPFLYLEPPTLSRVKRATKRTFDVLTAGTLLVLASPILAVAALAVRRQDGAPAIFRQVRVGRDGREFTLLKLRTMVPDADSRLVDLTTANQRAGGPLFKVAVDPRRTRVGRFLERTSIDELPQLINVLRGDMSIVGPRPALPQEVADFDPEFQARHLVRPGITGLWQAEAREKPDFEVYRRLDLFYVENWSIGLDLAICFATATSVARRTVIR